MGLHDGIFNGQYLFKCEPKKGSYVLPEFVFPLESPNKNQESTTNSKDDSNDMNKNDNLDEF